MSNHAFVIGILAPKLDIVKCSGATTNIFASFWGKKGENKQKIIICRTCKTQNKYTLNAISLSATYNHPKPGNLGRFETTTKHIEFH